MKHTILISGGHHNSALTIAESLKAKHYSLAWVGHRHTMIGDKHDSLEYQEVTALKIPFINLIAGKFHRRAHPVHFFRIPFGFIQSFFIILKTKPSLILSFGGYLAVPISIIAKLFSVPIITFEQTASIGRANKILSRLSLQNFLAFKSSLPFFPPHNTQVIGLPLPQNFLNQKSRITSPPTLLITGGKQGSHPINLSVSKIIPELVKKFNVIHLTGFSRKTKDFESAQNIRQHLPQKSKSQYTIYPHLPSQKFNQILKSSSLVLTRAGAHTVYYLLALQKPAILIPLPFSFNNEQHQNAQKLVSKGLGTIMPQKDLTPQKLLQVISKHSLKPSKISPSVSTTATKQAIDYIVKHFPNAQKKT